MATQKAPQLVIPGSKTEIEERIDSLCQRHQDATAQRKEVDAEIEAAMIEIVALCEESAIQKYRFTRADGEQYVYTRRETAKWLCRRPNKEDDEE